MCRVVLDQQKESDYDTSDDDLTSSMTLPTIEDVLKTEGIKPHSITQQLDKFRSSRKPKLVNTTDLLRDCFRPGCSPFYHP